MFRYINGILLWKHLDYVTKGPCTLASFAAIDFQRDFLLSKDVNEWIDNKINVLSAFPLI
jgi:hypothetical protein